MKIELNEGRTIGLLEFTQKLTYEGLIEGLPTTRRNKAYLDTLAGDRTWGSVIHAPLLIRPTETPIDWSQEKTPYPFGTPATLPGVTCIARFGSHKAVAEGAWTCRSELVVIWLQNEFAFPIDTTVQAQIRDLDWRRLAVDIEI